MSKQRRQKKDLILVVDDQANNLNAISSVLGEEYAVSIANNGMNALKILENSIPELILLDIMMPEMDGFEVCRRIKEDERIREIPLIFLTAKTDIEDIRKGFECGAVDYITKPFNPKEVKVRVRNHLEMHHAKKDLRYQNSFLQFFAEIADEFNKSTIDNLDHTIHSSLKKMGEFFGFQRGWVFRFSEERKNISITQEWRQKGFKSHIQRMQEVPCESLPWLCKKMKSYKPLIIDDFENLPQEAELEKKEFQYRAAKGLCVFPIIYESTSIGFLGFEALEDNREWKEEDTKLMKIVVQTFTKALNRKIVEEKLLEAEKLSTALAMVVTTNHELNQPLMIIQGNIEMLKSKQDLVSCPSCGKYINVIEKAIERIGVILRRMREIEDIELKKYINGVDMISLGE